jgi:hypothetical protein
MAALGHHPGNPAPHPRPLCNDAILRTCPASPENARLAHAARHGFDIGYNGKPLRVWTDNHESFYGQHADIADRLLDEHIKKGWMIDVTPLYRARSLMRCITSPQAIIPKSTPGKFRLLFDGSHGVGTNVNDNCDVSAMPIPLCTSAAAVRAQISSCATANPGATVLMYTTDLADAYKTLPVRPEHWHTLAVPWRSRILWNTVAPFGLRSSAAHLYEATRPAVTRLTSAGIPVELFVDDAFTCAIPSAMEGPLGHRAQLRLAFRDAGFTIQDLKEVPPSTTRKFIGWVFDTNANTQTLPAAKLHALRDAIQSAASARRMRRSKLESLMGHLHHASEGSRHLSAFTAELQHLLSTAHRGQWITLSAAARLDLALWDAFADHFSGTIPITPPAATASVYTDACTSWGWGWHCPDLRLYGSGQWPADLAADIASGALHINALELIAAIIAIVSIHHLAPEATLQLYCDNTAAVACIERGRGKAGPMARITRSLAFLLETTGSHTPPPHALHIKGTLNEAADALSRGGTPEALRGHTPYTCPPSWIAWLARCEAPWHALLRSPTTAPLGLPSQLSPSEPAPHWCPPRGKSPPSF